MQYYIRSGPGSSEMAKKPRLTSTSFAVLGLLARGPMSAYEIAKETRDSLNHFWPRAERRIYDEPKRLAAAGYVTFEEQKRSGRWRTVYTISPAGRRALQDWFSRGCPPPQFESEAVLKVSLGDLAEPGQLKEILEDLEDQSRARLAEGRELAEQFSHADLSPERLEASALMFGFVFDQARRMEEWSKWARQEMGRAEGQTLERRAEEARRILTAFLGDHPPF